MHKSGIFSNGGPLVQELERRYASLLSVHPDQVVATSSGTQALSSLISVMQPELWRIPDWTFSASGLSVIQAGKTPVLVDVNPDTWRLDILEGTVDMGQMIVMPFGNLVEPDTLPGDATLLIDAAASLGNLENLSELGENHAIMYSLHATKVFGCGEGGLAVCGSVQTAERLRMHINFGFNGERKSEIFGTNGKMSEVHAAMALAALDERHTESEEWSRTHKILNEITEEFELETGPTSLDLVHPYWVVDFQNARSRAMAEQIFEKHGIGFRRWWSSPLSEMRAFARYSSQANQNSARLSRIVLGLPCFRDFSANDAESIRMGLHEFTKSNGPSSRCLKSF